jgi:undecaprenyl-diphosphatase
MRPGWIAGAVALALFLVLRRRSLSTVWLAAGALAATAGLLVGLGVIPIPDVAQVIEDVGRALGPWTYLFAGGLAFLETGAFVGLIAPGETAVLVAGVVAGQGEIDLWVLIAIVWAAATLGDLTSYTLGRRLGRGFIERHGPRLKITEERLQHVDRFFERRGGMTILVGRFIGLVRSVAPFIAGSSRMPLRIFLPYDVLGAGLWAALFCTLGYLFWHSLDRVTAYLGRGVFALATLVALVAALVYARRLQHDPEERARARAWIDAQLERPALRPAGRVLRPAWRRVGRPVAEHSVAPARFVWHRFTPGELGLELTTLLALLAVGAFGFVFLGTLVGGAEPMLDRWASAASDRLALEPALEVVSVITVLGSSVVTLAAVVATAVWALAHRRPYDAVALILAWLVTVGLVHLAKALYARPRPDDPYVDTFGLGYPSGHAAYAVALVACAVVLVRAGSPVALRFAAVTVALVGVVVVGLSRVYLRVHFLTDVLGGIALGTAAFSLVGCIALVVAHLRENPVPART